MAGQGKWGSRSSRAGGVDDGVVLEEGKNCAGGRFEARKEVGTVLLVESLPYAGQWEGTKRGWGRGDEQ